MRERTWVRVIRLGVWTLIFLGGLSAAAFSATLTVTSTADSGAGTLRNQVAAASSGDTLVFNLAYPATITLSSTLTLNKNLAIAGPGVANLSISGGNACRVLAVTAGTVSLSDLAVTNGRTSVASDTGGGIQISGTASLILDRCAVRNCSLLGTGSVYGGGIFVTNTSSLTVRRSTFSGNTVPTGAGSGGALYNAGTLVVTDSAFTGNSARLGAAVYAYQGLGKTATLVNCTISGNTTDNQGSVLLDGTNTASGAPSGASSGSLLLTNCTITNNTATTIYEAGLSAFGGGTLTLRNTVVAANNALNGAGDTDIFFDTPGVYGAIITLVSAGYNWVGSTGSQTYTWSTGDVVGSEASKQNPNLAALADNGGYVQTHMPNLGSLVVDPASSNGSVFVDGRGYSRVNNSDRGACERYGSAPAASAASGVGVTGFNANWNSMANAAGYLLDVATNAAFTSMVPGYWGLDVSNVTTYAVTGLSGNTTYYYRVRGYFGANHTYYTNAITVTTAAPSPTSTPTVTPTWTRSVTSTITPTQTATPTLTQTATLTVTPSATRSATVSQTATQVPSLTATPTATVSVSSTRTPTLTPTQTMTATRSATLTLTITPTATRTPSFTVTGTQTPRATVTPTLTASPVLSATPMGTGTPTSAPTSTGTVAPETPVAIHADVRAYPNPAGRQMRFGFKVQPGAGSAEVALYNLSGERVTLLTGSISAGLPYLLWDCSGVAPGVYLARVKYGDVDRKIKVAVAGK